MAVKIKPFKFEDQTTGVTIEVVEGKHLNQIKLLLPKKVQLRNRDYFFAKDGSFDGTGSTVEK